MANYGEISKKIFTRTLHSHALSTYTRTYAKSYRSSDDAYYSSSHDTGRFAFVQKVCSSYHAPAVLDMVVVLVGISIATVMPNQWSGSISRDRCS
jgi:hypothetical protein